MKKYLYLIGLLMAASSNLSAITPEQVLRDDQTSSLQNGVVTRKGSIKAMIESVLELNRLLSQKDVSDQAKVDIKDLRESMKGLQSLHVFEIFPIRDWLIGSDNPGQLIVGVLALQQFPEMMTPKIKERLSHLSKNVHPLVKNEIEKMI